MNEALLKTFKTAVLAERDLTQWHQGISSYGFWAIEVRDPAWLGLFNAARLYMEEFIRPGYQRAPHITVVACGLIDKGHFHAGLLERQEEALAEALPVSFSLHAGPLASFPTAPYIRVDDPDGAINNIRKILTSISPEDDPPLYQSHVTLGLYRYAFRTGGVADRLDAFQYPPVSHMAVSELIYCSYETGDEQGPFSVIKRIGLT